MEDLVETERVWEAIRKLAGSEEKIESHPTEDYVELRKWCIVLTRRLSACAFGGRDVELPLRDFLAVDNNAHIEIRQNNQSSTYTLKVCNDA